MGDLAGFAAASLLRGVDFVQIPTSLLAQVDSSVGGKTGVNAAVGKNLIGAFYQPKAVLADTSLLVSLPERELRAGYAEVAKYGLLGDAKFFTWLEENSSAVLALEPDAIMHAILRSCEAKARIVEVDEREAGERALLNLGHTFAHALEAEAGYNGSLLHGEAVAAGLLRIPAHLTEVVLDELAEAEHRRRAIDVEVILLPDHRDREIRELAQRARAQDRLERERSDGPRAPDVLLLLHVGDVPACA